MSDYLLESILPTGKLINTGGPVSRNITRRGVPKNNNNIGTPLHLSVFKIDKEEPVLSAEDPLDTHIFDKYDKFSYLIWVKICCLSLYLISANVNEENLLALFISRFLSSHALYDKNHEKAQIFAQKLILVIRDLNNSIPSRETIRLKRGTTSGGLEKSIREIWKNIGIKDSKKILKIYSGVCCDIYHKINKDNTFIIKFDKEMSSLLESFSDCFEGIESLVYVNKIKIDETENMRENAATKAVFDKYGYARNSRKSILASVGLLTESSVEYHEGKYKIENIFCGNFAESVAESCSMNIPTFFSEDGVSFVFLSYKTLTSDIDIRRADSEASLDISNLKSNLPEDMRRLFENEEIRSLHIIGFGVLSKSKKLNLCKDNTSQDSKLQMYKSYLTSFSNRKDSKKDKLVLKSKTAKENKVGKIASFSIQDKENISGDIPGMDYQYLELQNESSFLQPLVLNCKKWLECNLLPREMCSGKMMSQDFPTILIQEGDLAPSMINIQNIKLGSLGFCIKPKDLYFLRLVSMLSSNSSFMNKTPEKEAIDSTRKTEQKSRIESDLREVKTENKQEDTKKDTFVPPESRERNDSGQKSRMPGSTEKSGETEVKTENKNLDIDTNELFSGGNQSAPPGSNNDFGDNPFDTSFLDED